MTTPSSPTVVLVHGAFADASSYSGVITRLLADGIDVLAPAVPLRGLVDDAAYLTSVIRSIPGPVLLVGHSYGGALITVAGVQENVVGLVYLAAYVLDEGESLVQLESHAGPTDRDAALVSTPFTGPDGAQGVEVTLAADRFADVFAHDADQELTKVLALSQRPLSTAAFDQLASAAAWKTKPAWGIVSSSDRVINPDVERFGYQRAGVETVEVDASHAVMLAHPDEVVALVHRALQSLTA